MKFSRLVSGTFDPTFCDLVGLLALILVTANMSHFGYQVTGSHGWSGACCDGVEERRESRIDGFWRCLPILHPSFMDGGTYPITLLTMGCTRYPWLNLILVPVDDMDTRILVSKCDEKASRLALDDRVCAISRYMSWICQGLEP